MDHPPLETIAIRLLELARCAEQDVELCGHIARTVVHGQPVPQAALTSSLATTSDNLEARLARLPGVEVDQEGHILGWGLTLVPTPHQVRMNGKSLFAWCAFDTIQFPLALQVEAQISSTCPVTGTPLQFVVTAAGTIQDLGVTQIWMSLLLPEHCATFANSTVIVPERTGKGKGNAAARPAFCEQSLFFHSEEAASAHLATHPHAVLLSLEEAAQLAWLVTHHCVQQSW